MPNVTESVSNHTSPFNSTVSTTPNNSTNDLNKLANVTGQALATLWARTVNWFSAWRNPLPSTSEVVKQRIFQQKIELLQRSLRLLKNRPDQDTVQYVEKFLDDLPPFLRDDEIFYRDVLTNIAKIIKPRVALYFLEQNIDFSLVNYFLENLKWCGLAYKDLIGRLSNSMPISPDEDLEQLTLAWKKQASSPLYREWHSKINDEFLMNVKKFLEHCQQSGCDDRLRLTAQKARLISNVYPPKLIMALGGIEKFLNIPVLLITHAHSHHPKYVAYDRKEFDFLPQEPHELDKIIEISPYSTCASGNTTANYNCLIFVTPAQHHYLSQGEVGWKKLLPRDPESMYDSLHANLTPSDMPYPIMRGVDTYGRPFLVICTIEEGKERIEFLTQQYGGDLRHLWESKVEERLRFRKLFISEFPNERNLSPFDKDMMRIDSDDGEDEMNFLAQIVKGIARYRTFHRSSHDSRPKAVDDPNGPPINLCRR